MRTKFLICETLNSLKYINFCEQQNCKQTCIGTTLLKSSEKRDSGRNYKKKLNLLYSFKADRQTSHKSKLIRKYHGEGKHDHYWLLPSRTNFRHQFFIFSFFQIRSQCFHRPLLTHCAAEMQLSA